MIVRIGMVNLEDEYCGGGGVGGVIGGALGRCQATLWVGGGGRQASRRLGGGSLGWFCCLVFSDMCFCLRPLHHAGFWGLVGRRFAVVGLSRTSDPGVTLPPVLDRKMLTLIG
uniref:Uncharacterized protein n=1 Tax=Knipowitschia caucasica TaxID=637954 RepID=A0AAV2KE18_KNICA